VSDTRARLVTATNELFRVRGYHGTSVKDITAAAPATTGSLYHYFPGGKADLAAAVLAESGEAYRQLFVAIADESTGPVEAIRAMFDGAADVLEAIEFVEICPIGTVAREVASLDETLRQACSSVFESWWATVASRFVDAGVAGDEADRLGRVAVAAFEGAVLLARTDRDAGVVRDAGAMVADLVAACLRNADAVTAPTPQG
jgi:AcrR family transcriptional regulator